MGNWLETRSEHGEFPISYCWFMDRFKKVVTDVINRDDKFGTHTMRKTFYLISVWSGAEEGDLFKSARHANHKHAMTYKKDSMALLHIMESNLLSTDGMKSVWRSPFVEQVQLARALNTRHAIHVKNLTAIARHLIETVCGINLQHVNHGHLRQTLHALLNMTRRTSAKEELEVELKDLSEDKQKKIKKLIDQYVVELRTEAPISEADIPEAREEVPEEDKENKRGGTNNLAGRELVAKINSLKPKVEKIVEVFKSVPDDNSEMTEAARNWVIRTARPVMNCLTNHYGGDIDKFVTAWPDFKPSLFVKGCKGVEGERCAAEK